MRWSHREANALLTIAYPSSTDVRESALQLCEKTRNLEQQILDKCFGIFLRSCCTVLLCFKHGVHNQNSREGLKSMYKFCIYANCVSLSPHEL